MLTTSVEAICLNYRPKKDNTFPIMLRLTKSGKRKYVSKGLGLQEKPAEEIMSRQRSHCQTHKRQSIIMRTRSGTGRSFICLALQIATAGRKGIRLHIPIDKSKLNQFEITLGGQHKFSLFLYLGVSFQDKEELNWKHLLINYIRLTSKSNWELNWKLCL